MRTDLTINLPCAAGDTVYTIEEDFFNCECCKYYKESYYDEALRLTHCDKNLACPCKIVSHVVQGFVVTFKDGQPRLSNPGEFGYEGLEEFEGVDGKVHYTEDEARLALEQFVRGRK